MKASAARGMWPPLNRWPVLKGCNCLFTAATKSPSALTVPSQHSANGRRLATGIESKHFFPYLFEFSFCDWCALQQSASDGWTVQSQNSPCSENICLIMAEGAYEGNVWDIATEIVNYIPLPYGITSQPCQKSRILMVSIVNSWPKQVCVVNWLDQWFPNWGGGRQSSRGSWYALRTNKDL